MNNWITVLVTTMSAPNIFGRVMSIVLIGFWAAAGAAATESTSRKIILDFQRSAEVLPQKMRDQGRTQFGDFQADAISKGLPTVQLAITNSVAHEQVIGGTIKMERNSAEWHRGKHHGSIKINGDMWAKTATKIKPMLALHEMLGVLGYTDDTFTCSGAIWLLTNKKAVSALRSDELSQIERIAESACKFAGGSTGVYGGGDEYDVRAKIMIMEENIASAGAAKSKVARDQAINALEGSFYDDFEVNRHPHAGFADIIDTSKQCLDRVPEPGSIRVWVEEKPIVEDPVNGWTYDAKTNCVHVHGRAIRPPKFDGTPGLAILSTPVR